MKSILLFFLLQIIAPLNHVGQNINTKKYNELAELLNSQYAKKFSFSVLIEVNHVPVFSEQFGFVDKRKKNPLNENTLFNIASITKSLTAVGIIKLVEQNKISLQDSLSMFFENVPTDKSAITIHQLLSHQTGFQQNYVCEGLTSSAEALNALLNDKLKFSPGKDFSYSNQNYQMLALIIETVSKMNYEAFIRKEVLMPLEMTNTYFWNEVVKTDNVVYANKRTMKLFGQKNWGFIGSTGIFTTTDNLSKFWNGVTSGEIISKKSVNTLFKSYYETGSGLQIGYGFFKSPKTKWNSVELWTRGTESWGHNAVIRFFPEKNTTIIVCTNSGELGRDKISANKIISNMISDYLFE